MMYFLINSLAGGGAEKVLVRIAEYLKPKKILLLESDVKYHVDEKLLCFLSSHSVKTSPLLKTLFIPYYAFRFSQVVVKESVVVSFLERANYVNVLSKLFKDHRAVISVRMDQLTGRSGVGRLYNILSRLFYPQADLCIAVSCGVKESLVKLGVPEGKIKVIYNPYPIEEIQQKARQDVEEAFKSFPYLINVGRLTKQKGQWYLIRIFKSLREAFPDLRLLILGDGELKDYLYNLCKTLDLKAYLWDKDRLSEDFDVYFLGFKDNPFKYISRAKLFLFPSLFEGFPNALVEALACGVPVVSSDCRSGPREILAPDSDYRHNTDKPEFAKYGVLMPVFDGKFLQDEPLTQEEKMWVEVIKSMLKDQSILNKYSKRGIQRAYDFHVEKIVKDWQQAINEVLP